MAKRTRHPDRAITRRMGRKAQAESQLNWIFILIVGAVILGFFGFIVVKQQAASEAKFAGKVSTQLNTILVGAKVASGTVQEIPTPDLEIRFTCNDYYIGPASQRLGNRLLFAPEYLEGNKLITWTLDWNVPFKVTSMLYMTSPSVRYVIIGPSVDDRETKSLFDSLPAKLNKHMFSVSDYNSGLIKNDNDRRVRFIFVNVGSSFNLPSEFQGEEVSGLTVDTANHNVQFLVPSGTSLITSGGVHIYTEPEPLYGAIFSDVSREYECLMDRAYDRVNMVANVYFEKFKEIAPIYASTICEGNYRENPHLKDMIAATSVYPPDYGVIGTAKTSLYQQNIALQLKSCPLIY